MDQEVWRKLEASGWYVLVVWECEMKKGRFEDTVECVTEAIRMNGKAYKQLQAVRKKSRALYLEEQRQRKERESAVMDEISRLRSK